MTKFITVLVRETPSEYDSLIDVRYIINTEKILRVATLVNEEDKSELYVANLILDGGVSLLLSKQSYERLIKDLKYLYGDSYLDL